MKRVSAAAIALIAAAIILVVASLPPARQTLAAAPDDGTVAGVLHIHTRRSDGRGTPDDIAAAAARAGLKFLVFTDHGDATRQPDPPTYRSGVLCLDGVEISTNGGHYIAVGMPAAPYRLAGDARDVVEDVRRLGGFGIVAHPDSPKPLLQWREWTAPFDAIETVNPDTSWRVRVSWPGWRSRLSLARSLIAYPFRPAETIGHMLQGTTALYRWESLTRRRRVVTIAGADAHAKLALRDSDPGDNRWSLPFPGYESTFRALSVHARLEHPLTGEAASDAAMLLRALRAGHLYTVVDGLATPASFDLTATNEHGTVHAGDELVVGGPVTLRVRTNAPAGDTLTLWNGTELVASQPAARDVSLIVGSQPAVYWAELRTGGKTPMTWLTSNPVYVRGAGPAMSLPVRPAATSSDQLFDGQSTLGWRVEHDPASRGTVSAPESAGAHQLQFEYALGPGEPLGQYAALVVDRPAGIAGQDRLAITMRADRPMRVSVQLRAPARGVNTSRWERSVYVDTFDQDRTIFLDEFLPLGETSTFRPDAAAIRSIMFVVELTNTKPGSSGTLWIRNAALQH